MENEWIFLRYLNKGNFADSLFAIEIALKVGNDWGNVNRWPWGDIESGSSSTRWKGRSKQTVSEMGFIFAVLLPAY